MSTYGYILLGTENIYVGLEKGHVRVGDCCTFELVLVTYTPCGGNHQRRQDFHPWEFLSAFAVNHTLQRLLSVFHHWLNFLLDNVPGVCYDFSFFPPIFLHCCFLSSGFHLLAHKNSSLLKIGGKTNMPIREVALCLRPGLGNFRQLVQ